MTKDPFIGGAMHKRIEHELGAIATAHGVRILLAIESGSRAWRFPSSDSDYDVRFIYVHPTAAYISVEPPREVIDGLQDDPLDVSGWDVRKALRLLVRSNAVLLEWLTSPVRYREAGAVPEQLLALARETCHLPAIEYHYDRLARHSFDEISAAGDVRLKAYCYAMRPALALRWMRRHGEPPPMDVPSLLDGLDIPDDLRHAMLTLIERKASASERDVAARIPMLDGFVADTLAQPVDRFALPDRATVLARADALFAAILRDDPGVVATTPADR